MSSVILQMLKPLIDMICSWILKWLLLWYHDQRHAVYISHCITLKLVHAISDGISLPLQCLTTRFTSNRIIPHLTIILTTDSHFIYILSTSMMFDGRFRVITLHALHENMKCLFPQRHFMFSCRVVTLKTDFLSRCLFSSCGIPLGVYSGKTTC